MLLLMQSDNKDILNGNVLRVELFLPDEVIVGDVCGHDFLEIFVKHVKYVLWGHPKGIFL
jgi:hypothetical protein